MDEHIADKSISSIKSNTKSERLCQSGKQLLTQAEIARLLEEIALFWQSTSTHKEHLKYPDFLALHKQQIY